MICPHCSKEIDPKIIAKHLGSRGGQVKSDAKANAARTNGKKGGRPVLPKNWGKVK